MLQDIPDSLRASILRDPADVQACEALIRRLDDDRTVYRWFSRVLAMVCDDVTGIEGLALRKGMLSVRAVDDATLHRAIAAIDFRHHERIMPVVFFSAALLATGRVDIAEASRRQAAFEACADGIEKATALLSTTVTAASPAEAYTLCILKHYVTTLLRTAGFIEHTDRMARHTSDFMVRMRKRYGVEGERVLGWRWTFAIGHMVLTAFLAKGRDAGLFDGACTKIWDGRMANDALRDRLLALSDTVQPVPLGTLFAETFGAYLKERVDGRTVDLFEACGIIADRAGDAHGAILSRPERTDPVLAAFFEATGLAPEDRIVTLHCREGGFRRDGQQDVRNVDIRTYLAAVEELSARGYKIVRLGDRSMTSLPTMAGVVDYAHSPLKTKALDVLLPATAAFHIGSSSGLSQVPLLFATPCLYLNWYPCDLLPWGRRNWTVVKPITAETDGHRVTDWAAYRELAQHHSPRVLNTLGHDLSALTGDEIRETVLAFATALQTADAAPEKKGVNLSRILLADDNGALIDVTPADGTVG